MKFKEGTTVYTADGDKIGDIERFVLDPQGEEISGLVVRKGFIFTEDKVIPPDAVATADEDRVTLHREVGNPDEFPPFTETHYVHPDQTNPSEVWMQPYNGPVYYYPPVGVRGWTRPNYFFDRPTETDRNIPSGTVALKEGADVISRDGKDVGNVKEIITDDETDEITHFLVERGVFFKEEKLIPASWVKHAREDEIELAVNASSLKRLEEV